MAEQGRFAPLTEAIGFPQSGEISKTMFFRLRVLSGFSPNEHTPEAYRQHHEEQLVYGEGGVVTAAYRYRRYIHTQYEGKPEESFHLLAQNDGHDPQLVIVTYNRDGARIIHALRPGKMPEGISDVLVPHPDSAVPALPPLSQFPNKIDFRNTVDGFVNQARSRNFGYPVLFPAAPPASVTGE